MARLWWLGLLLKVLLSVQKFLVELALQKYRLESVRAIQRLVEEKTLAEVTSLVEGKTLAEVTSLVEGKTLA